MVCSVSETCGEFMLALACLIALSLICKINCLCIMFVIAEYIWADNPFRNQIDGSIILELLMDEFIPEM